MTKSVTKPVQIRIEVTVGVTKVDLLSGIIDLSSQSDSSRKLIDSQVALQCKHLFDSIVQTIGTKY